MRVKHEWVTLENGDRQLTTRVLGLAGKVIVSAAVVAAAKTDVEKLQDDVADKLLLQIYPLKQGALEPILMTLYRLIPQADRLAAQQIFNEIRTVTYSNPPVEVVE